VGAGPAAGRAAGGYQGETGRGKAVSAPRLADRLANRLAGRLVRHIRAHGPLTVAAFMAMALHDPQAGYYARRQPLGAAGDFTTAPEISQIFGELIGLWCADRWQCMGRPDPVVVAELGPGRGVLMADFLRAASRVAGFRQAMRLCLVEASPVLRAEQQKRLASCSPVWLESADALPDGPLLVVANEFLDALPIRQLVRGRTGWGERLVALDAAGGLCFAEGAENAALALLVPPARRGAAPGAIAEICPAATALAASLGQRFTRWPGAALFVDYGYAEPAAGSTLAAVGGHRAAGVLDDPGAADLSAHVDFAAFAAAAKSAGATVIGPVAQGDFLTALGAGTRLATLLRHAAPEQRAGLAAGLRRLIDPGEMGTLFKVLGVMSPALPAPAGFAEAGA
jgi:NADH dehydrogenase [ubiquinone] 1 alpha subcomplex assembly factor 7